MAFIGTGLGTLASPYLITTPAEFRSIPDNTTAYYKLMNNIDLNGLGVNITFKGNFDGDGKVIDNLKGDTAGLFASVVGTSSARATVKNLGFTNLAIVQSVVKTYNYAGAICGTIVGGVTISKVWAVGTLNINGTSVNPECGGLIGLVTVTNDGTTGVLIQDCFARVVIVAGSNTTHTVYVGGLIGRTNIWTNGYGTIERCYARGMLYANGNSSKIESGFTSPLNTTIANCYFDNETLDYNSEKNVDSTAIGKTNAQMKLVNMGTNWAVDATNDGFPHLTFLPPAVIESRTLTSFVKKIFSNIATIPRKARISEVYSNKIFSDISTERKLTVELNTFVKPVYANAVKTNPKFVVTTFVKPIQASIEVLGRHVMVELKATAHKIISTISTNRINTVSGITYVKPIKVEVTNGRKFKTISATFISPIKVGIAVRAKLTAKVFTKKIYSDIELEGNNFKVLRAKVKPIKVGVTQKHNHLVVLETFVKKISALVNTQIKDKIIPKLTLNTDWTPTVIVGDTIKITLDIESKNGSQSHVKTGTLKVMDNERLVLDTLDISALHEVSFGFYEFMYTVPDGYGPLYVEFTATTDEYPIAVRLKLDRQWA